jgi:hypothetical protein
MNNKFPYEWKEKGNIKERKQRHVTLNHRHIPTEEPTKYLGIPMITAILCRHENKRGLLHLQTEHSDSKAITHGHRIV